MAGSNSSPGRDIGAKAGASLRKRALDGPETAQAIAAFLPHPLPVSVRVSDRSKGVSLRFLPERGLEVVTPPGVPSEYLVAAVGQRREWLARVCERLAAEGGLPTGIAPPRPEWLVLTAFARQWRVDYLPREYEGCQLTVRGPESVVVSGAVRDVAAASGVLAAFCRDRGGTLLRQALAAVSRESGLAYDGVTIRAQRTRWGSCTAKGHISLNYTLAFLPWELTRLVLLHELCHTRELNHSARFWNLLERYVPDCRMVDARLGAARHYLPLWLRQDFTAAPR